MMDELINRQDVKFALSQLGAYFGIKVRDNHDDEIAIELFGRVEEIKKYFDSLPSAQPEIIRCKDCKWYELPSHKITENCVRWMERKGILLPIKPNDYCSYAERKTDECID